MGPHAAAVGPVEADRGRIQRHLADVEAELRGRDVAHLPDALQAERRRNLDRLHAYRLAGQFPRNSGHPGERVPYFIDDAGTACAVGHLVVESGFAAVARDIRADQNNARLLAITHPALPGWIAASGLTADECARIQPTYCGCSDEYEPVCSTSGQTYQNACTAETCAGETIAHTGVCEGPGTTSWPAPGTTTDPGTASGESTAGGDSSDTSSSSGGDSSDTSGEPEESVDHEPGAKTRASGCRVAGPDAGLSLFALLLLGLRRRVRS